MSLFKRKPKCKYCEYFFYAQRKDFSNNVCRTKRKCWCNKNNVVVKNGYPACNTFKWSKEFEDAS